MKFLLMHKLGHIKGQQENYTIFIELTVQELISTRYWFPTSTRAAQKIIELTKIKITVYMFKIQLLFTR